MRQSSSVVDLGIARMCRLTAATGGASRPPVFYIAKCWLKWF
jgi:hypothetical protein